MKKFNFILVALFSIFTFHFSYAKVWRVNNGAFNAQYTDINSAVNASTTLPGDTIHVEPSQTAYAAATITKRVVLIGNGYYLSGTGSNPGLQANTFNSTVSSINLNAGSAGTIIQGLALNGLAIREKHITVRRNFIPTWSYLYTGADSVNFYQNAFYGVYYSGSFNAKRIVISNNLFVAGGGYGVTLPSTIFPIIENNTFVNGCALNVFNAQINNNIWAGGTVTLNNSVAFNNICATTEFPSGNGNVRNVSMTTVFVGTGSTDGAYFLKSGSPAFGAGFNGVDCGMTGGTIPYHLSGIPDVPTIYQMTVPATGTNSINVTISTRSNN